METLVRVHRESLRTVILERRGLVRKTLVWKIGALIGWQVMWASLSFPTKIWVLTPPWIVCFIVWRVERFPLVVKSISLLYLDCSLNLRKVGAVYS